ncbi:MAG: hypothetical protein A3I04_06490 [Nitrospinae bacterium RIFCSPLOWO2_02_FULL_39_110]|nr:MAG: hypothetical protein A3D20_00850 [Nitrospinae bacterium RIFCSPHIGHO2_02_FULL_39_82]OGW04595.1 MAG: hypothetical protein A3I04_06490 [Nitrospinae bacterium RIFCSPLOWO2_02_FULL_39_110]OGW08623.1 MAG: hypothetical protein A3F81_00250 [Nitrospinae bacterium RIFCSPLOWO2_12_FULL_39_93]OGW09624.1 MAG: hypothetical protein A2W75_01910 [Nitrospinae bacterium RIFCSPLOWO2_12_39_15]
MNKDTKQQFDVDPVLEKISPHIPDTEIDFRANVRGSILHKELPKASGLKRAVKALTLLDIKTYLTPLAKDKRQKSYDTSYQFY